MLVRYRTNAGCTLANFQTDLNNIILGNITSVNDLSAGADTGATQIYGTYPVGIYARVNGTSYTYSKRHSTETTYTHYFRFTFDAVGITNIALAQNYTSGTDALLNSSSMAMVVFPVAYSAATTCGIDILVSDKTITILSTILSSQVKLSITDLGHTGVTRQYTNSMLMSINNHYNVSGNISVLCPYTYNFDISGYSPLTAEAQLITSGRKGAGPGITTVFENPMFGLFQAPALICGTYKISSQTFFGQQIYKDASDNYRLSVNDLTFLVD